MNHFEHLRRQWRDLERSSLATSSYGFPVARIGGRQTQPNQYPIIGSLVSRAYQEYHGKDLNDIGSWDHQSILKIIRQISPEASQAITTYLRIFDSGYTIEVKKANGEDHKQAKGKLLAWISKMETPNGQQFQMPIGIRDMALKLALDVLIKGAGGSELVLDDNFYPVEPAYVDPWSISFEWNQTQKRWIPQQTTDRGYIVLDIPTFAWVPVDPLGNDPYGEEQINSAIRAILFKIQVMQDLKQAVHTNAWSRLDFALMEEVIIKAAPAQLKTDPTKLAEFVTAQLNAYKDIFASLAPDENLVHTDSMTVKGLEATSNGKGVFDPTPLLQAIDSQITNSLKTFQSILSKKLGGGSEGFTSIEGVLYMKMIAGFQSIVEDVFERLLTMALRYMGIIAKINFKFAKPELRSDMEISQYKAVEIKNVTTMFDEQAIGEVEKRERLRNLGGFTGPVPNDINPERIRGNGDPNQPNRPAESEAEKESQRADTNRSRRSGQGD